MGTPARERMRIWRERMKAAGYRELNVWLSPRALEHLEERVSEKHDQSRRDAVSGSIEEALLEAGTAPAESSLQEPRDNQLTEDQESTIANLRATIRRLLRQRVTLTDQERDEIEMAAASLRRKRSHAEQNTGARLQAMIERIEAETEEAETMAESVATVTSDEAATLIEVAEYLDGRRQAGHREKARLLRELAARFGAESNGKADRDPNTVDWLGSE